MNNGDETNITIERLNELKGNSSQEAFAKKINSTQSTVSKMFNGTPLSAANLIAIAKAYNVTTDWLLGLSNSKTIEHTISTASMTYADAIAVLDELYKRGSIRVGYDQNYEDPRDILVDDKILGYLLTARNQVAGAGKEMLEFWRKRAISDLGHSEVVNWDQDVESYLGQSADTIDSNASAASVAKFANDFVKNGPPEGYWDSMEELPFK